MAEFADFNYRDFWENLYKGKGTSGPGSYGVLAEFKGEIISKYIKDYDVKSVIDFGCGDGNQARYIRCEKYKGLDISETAVQMCKNLFREATNREFYVYDPQTFSPEGFKSDMVVCLDVLYHIIDDDDFKKTLDNIFACSNNLIVLYTKITSGEATRTVETIMDRDIIAILKQYTDFKIIQVVPQKYIDKSSAHFIILKKIDTEANK